MADEAEVHVRITLAAEGQGPGGQHWTLETGGPPAEYHMLFNVDYADGSRDGFGVSSQVPPETSPWESASGPARDTVQYFAWAHPEVRRLHVRSVSGEECHLLPAKDDQTAGVTLFAALMPWPGGIASERAFGSDGQELADADEGKTSDDDPH